MNKNKIAREVADKLAPREVVVAGEWKVWSQENESAFQCAQAALDKAIPEGHVVVPVEPTVEMCRAAIDLAASPEFGTLEGVWHALYKAMLQAAKGDV